MIILYTGLPGHSKTLNALDEILQIKDRPVYYSGINLTEKGKTELGWIELEDPKKWDDCPPNSIILIDECQRVFPNRSANSEPPEHVRPLETHRHKGYDIYLITQHPKLMDFAVRRLTGRHIHVYRPMNIERATLVEWARCVNEPTGDQERSKAALQTSKPFPKHVYDYYKSAEVHTMKRRIPKKVYVLVVGLVILGIILYFAVKSIMSIGQGFNLAPSAPQQQASVTSSDTGLVKVSNNASVRSNPVDEAFMDSQVLKLKYIYSLEPILPGKPESAPIYHSVQEPKTFPRAQCIASKSDCRCYTQQGTILRDISSSDCRSRIRNGQFDPTREDTTRQESDQLARDRLDKLLARAYPERQTASFVEKPKQIDVNDK